MEKQKEHHGKLKEDLRKRKERVNTKTMCCLEVSLQTVVCDITRTTCMSIVLLCFLSTDTQTSCPVEKAKTTQCTKSSRRAG